MKSLDVNAVLNLTWLVSTLLLAVTAMLVARRGLHREYPWFFRYVLVVCGRAPILYLLRGDRENYFYAYWSAEAVTVGLSFFVIFEIYRHVAGSSSLGVSRSTFFSLSVGFLAIAAIIAMLMDTPPGQPLITLILVLTHAVRTMQVGLLALLLVASLFFNFYWQSMPFGFALGYGVYAMAELLGTAFRTSFGPSGDSVFRLTKVLGYQLAVVLWITFIFRHREEHALKELPDEPLAEWLAVTERQS